MLEGIRVLDLTQNVAGPFAGKLLADLGVEVIKVEPPGRGDPSRYPVPWSDAGPDACPAPRYLYLNAGKLGLTLDLRSREGRTMFGRLAGLVDAVLEDADDNGRSPLSHAELSALKPALVLGSISSYGTGSGVPRRPSICEYATGGMLHATGEGAGRPVQTPDASSYIGGILLGTGVLSAVRRARQSGVGDHVDVSGADATLSLFYQQVTNYAYKGVVTGRRDPRQNPAVRRAADGWLYPYLTDKRPETIAGAASLMGIPELADPGFRTSGRYDEAVDGYFAGRGRYDAMREGSEAGLCWSVVQDPADMLACEHLECRGFFRAAQHSSAGSLRHAANPALPRGKPRTALTPAPSLGQDNGRVYGEWLGIDAAALASLSGRGVI